MDRNDYTLQSNAFEFPDGPVNRKQKRHIPPNRQQSMSVPTKNQASSKVLTSGNVARTKNRTLLVQSSSSCEYEGLDHSFGAIESFQYATTKPVDNVQNIFDFDTDMKSRCSRTDPRHKLKNHSSIEEDIELYSSSDDSSRAGPSIEQRGRPLSTPMNRPVLALPVKKSSGRKASTILRDTREEFQQEMSECDSQDIESFSSPDGFPSMSTPSLSPTCRSPPINNSTLTPQTSTHSFSSSPSIDLGQNRYASPGLVSFFFFFFCSPTCF